MGDKPVAAILRENELLRAVAERAIRLRSLGRQIDELDEVLEKLWAENPTMSKSGTQRIMLDQAFKVEMEALDQAIAAAATAGMDWTMGNPRPGIERPT